MAIQVMSRQIWEDRHEQIKAKEARAKQQQLSVQYQKHVFSSATSAAEFQKAAFEITRDQTAAMDKFLPRAATFNFPDLGTSDANSSQKPPTCTPCTAADALLLKAAVQMQAALAHTLDHLSRRAIGLTVNLLDGSSFNVQVPATGTAADLCAAVEKERGIEPFLQELFLMDHGDGDGGQAAAVVWHGHGRGGVGGDEDGMQQGGDGDDDENWGGKMLPLPGAGRFIDGHKSTIYSSTDHTEKLLMSYGIAHGSALLLRVSTPLGTVQRALECRCAEADMAVKEAEAEAKPNSVFSYTPTPFSGNSRSISNLSFVAITAMPAYSSQSYEELRADAMKAKGSN
jgi:hypothetical protein